MRPLKTLVILLCALPFSVFAQSFIANDNDITGLWTGTLFSDTTGNYSSYEIAITKDKGKYIGFSHTYFNIGGQQYYGVKKVNVKKANDGKIIIVDDQLVANNYPEYPGKYMKQLNVLTISSVDSAVTLTGPFVTNRTKEYQSLTGSIYLRKNTGESSALWPHLQELGKEKDFSFIQVSAPIMASADPVRTTAVVREEKKK